MYRKIAFVCCLYFVLNIDWLAIFATTFVRTISYQKSSSQQALWSFAKPSLHFNHANLPKKSHTRNHTPNWAKFPKTLKCYTADLCPAPFSPPKPHPPKQQTQLPQTDPRNPPSPVAVEEASVCRKLSPSRCHFGQPKWDTLAEKMALPAYFNGTNPRYKPTSSMTRNCGTILSSFPRPKLPQGMEASCNLCSNTQVKSRKNRTHPQIFIR